MNDRAALVGIGDDVPFATRLAQTIVWCAQRLDPDDPRGSLRSDALRPQVLEVSRAAAVAGVAWHRWVSDFEVRRAEAIRALDELRGGRLLAFFPDETLSDGAAELETGGFFDAHNTPPWDTWVALFSAGGRFASGALLVSWVPPELVATADRGIHVNPEGCIVWLADSRTTVAKLLKGRRLLG